MPAPIGIYVRVSRKGDREDDRFHSPKEQAERANALAVAKGYVPGPVFEDIDVSGATPPGERPAMGELLKAVERGELAGISAFSLDRLSREPAHGDALVKRVTKAGGVLLTPDIPDAIDSPTGEFTFGMLLQVARLYRSQAGARFATAKERAIRAGIPVGPPPTGYRLRPDRTLEPDPAVAPVVRELYERRAKGDGWTALADLLAERTGRQWTRQGVSGLLRNRIYATGRLEYGDLISDVAAEPLVDEPTWHAAQSTTPRPRAPRSSNGRWLLTGLARCAACGNSLIPWKSSGGKYRRYVCRNRRCEKRASVAAERLERWVVLQSFMAGDEVATRAEAPALGPLEDALDVAERRLAQVMAPEARDALGDLWAADVKARRTERDAAAARLGEARQVAGVDAVDFRLRDVWEGLSPTDRRAALSLFWKEIRVARKGTEGTPITLVARGPLGEAEVELP